MSINLRKGEKVDLRKENGGNLRRVMIGLGWDAAVRGKTAIDCDGSVFVCTGGRIRNPNDLVCYGNLVHPTNCVKHMGDNLTGAGDGDDEQIFAELTSLPAQYDKLVIVVTIYKANERGQHFGMIQNAYVRICDADSNREICRFNLSENYSGLTSMVFGELYLRNGEWKFNAIGQGTMDDGVVEISRRFM